VDQVSVCEKVSSSYAERPQNQHTDIDQDGAILLLVHDVVIKDLVIQSLGLPVSARHDEGQYKMGATGNPIKWGWRRRRRASVSGKNE
jgi:hypothetical protein